MSILDPIARLFRPSSFTPLSSELALIDTIWAIEPRYARRAEQVLARLDVAAHRAEFASEQQAALARGVHAGYFDDEDDTDNRPSKPYLVQDGVAWIYLTGPMTKRPTSWGNGSSTVLLRRQVRMAASDDDVKAIALVVDSPGGQVSGTADLASDIAAAASKKPVGCYAEDCCASAAYWCASACDFIWSNRTAWVGSIGTYTVIQDASAMGNKLGIKTYAVASSPYKAAGYPGTKLTDQQLADVQRQIDDMTSLFVGAVQSGRGLSQTQTEAVTDGRVHVGEKAVALKLIDRVATLDEFAAELIARGNGEAGSPPVDSDTNDDPDVDDLDPDDDPSDCSRTSRGAQGSGASTAATGRERGMGQMAKGFWAKVGAKLNLAADASDEEVQTAAALEVLTKDAGVPSAGAAAGGSAVPLQTAPASPAQHAAAQGLTSVQRALLDECQAAGLNTAEDLLKLRDLAKLGEEYEASVREDAKVQAVRAYGAVDGAKMAASVDTLAVDMVKAMGDGWRLEADKKFGINGKTGAAPKRVSAPAAMPVAVNDEAGAEGEAAKSAWDRLTPAQQAQGKQMGMTRDAKKKEAYALQVLGEAAPEE